MTDEVDVKEYNISTDENLFSAEVASQDCLKAGFTFETTEDSLTLVFGMKGDPYSGEESQAIARLLEGKKVLTDLSGQKARNALEALQTTNAKYESVWFMFSEVEDGFSEAGDYADG